MFNIIISYFCFFNAAFAVRGRLDPISSYVGGYPGNLGLKHDNYDQGGYGEKAFNPHKNLLETIPSMKVNNIESHLPSTGQGEILLETITSMLPQVTRSNERANIENKFSISKLKENSFIISHGIDNFEPDIERENENSEEEIENPVDIMSPSQRLKRAEVSPTYFGIEIRADLPSTTSVDLKKTKSIDTLASLKKSLTTSPTASPSVTLRKSNSDLDVSSLWAGISISSGTISQVVEPTPVPADELIPPPDLPQLYSNLSLPSGFIWGVATSAAQIEGAPAVDGRGPSVWDIAGHQLQPFTGEKYLDVTTESYYLYKEDALRLKAMGVSYYSLSLSWSRIFPFGNGTVNQLGIDHYHKVLDNLIENGITPIVTLHHFDTPFALQKAYGGFQSHQIVEDFANYARTVFLEYASKVHMWITINEPENYCTSLSALIGFTEETKQGSETSVVGPDAQYKCGHNVILAHAAAADVLRKEIDPKFGKGFISLKQSVQYTPPMTQSIGDLMASERNMVLTADWFSYPIYVSGDYSPEMKSILQDILPEFTAEEKLLVQGSSDFFAWDGYTGQPVSAPEGGFEACAQNKSHILWPICAQNVLELAGGWLPGGYADDGASWLHITPKNFRIGMNYFWRRYNPPAMIITEFGFARWNENEMPLNYAVFDDERVNYFHGYLHEALNAVNHDDINLIGVIAWAAMDNLEWVSGTKTRFGLQYVDYNTQKRYYKKSFFYFRDFFQKYILPDNNFISGSGFDKALDVFSK